MKGAAILAGVLAVVITSPASARSIGTLNPRAAAVCRRALPAPMPQKDFQEALARALTADPPLADMVRRWVNGGTVSAAERALLAAALLFYCREFYDAIRPDGFTPTIESNGRTTRKMQMARGSR
jgi:hypothetical protein